MDQSLVIETSDLTKKYNGFIAVDKLNLAIREGELFGLLGPNGAGKTTTVLMLLGLTEPTSGTCRVCGFNPFREPMKTKSITGYLAERMGVYEDLTPEQNLKYILKLNRVPESESHKRVKDALETVGASSYSNIKVGNLSRGMRQRVGIAGVLVKKPKVIFFDEPIQGLDPEGSRELLDLFKRLGKEEKTTILLLSHILHDVQHICDRMGIMMKGKMIAQGSIDELRHKKGEEWAIDIEAKNITQELMHELSSIQGVREVKRTGSLVSVESERDLRLELMEAFIRNKAPPLEIKARERSLEDIYVKYMEGT